MQRISQVALAQPVAPRQQPEGEDLPVMRRLGVDEPALHRLAVHVERPPERLKGPAGDGVERFPVFRRWAGDVIAIIHGETVLHRIKLQSTGRPVSRLPRGAATARPRQWKRARPAKG